MFCVTQLCVPLGLFFVTGDKKFVPIAIQLYQHIAPDNPVSLTRTVVFVYLLVIVSYHRQVTGSVMSVNLVRDVNSMISRL